ncbi:MAG: trypsin-like peptidase domain-containing protein [Planctomycetota bacterium]
MTETGLEDLARTTVCLGVQEDEHWVPKGCGFVVSDGRMLWLVTSAHVLERAGEQPLSAWVAREQGGALFGIGEVLREAGLGWITAAEHALAACVFPLQPEWGLKALPLNQLAPQGSLVPTRRLHAVSFPYGIEGFDPRSAAPILLPGGVCGVDEARGRIYHTVPCLPLNEGTPLLLEADAQGGRRLVLAGVMRSRALPAQPVAAQEIPATLAGFSVGTPVAQLVALLSSEVARAAAERVLAGQQRAGDDA